MIDVQAPLTQNKNFSQVRDSYFVLRWPFPTPPFQRALPAGYRLGGPALTSRQQETERRLLQANFSGGPMPLEKSLPGFRPDSPIYVFFGEDLVGGIYLCAAHEFEKNRHWGQLHYFFVEPQHRGKGLHSAMVGKAIAQAQQWGLEGLYINTDREGLPELYQRWGATLWKTIPKRNGPSGHVDTQPWNWLVHRIQEQAIWEAIRAYASGTLVDIGCGKKPHTKMTQGMVERHIGVDYSDTLHGLEGVDVVADAYHTTLPDAMADTALSTTVLEHLERPQDAMNELFRVLKPGGYAIITVPLFWHLHEEPRDFFRYTKHGLAHLMKTSGFEVVEMRPLSGFLVTFSQEICYFLEALPFSVPARLLRIAESILQNAGWQAHKRGWDKLEAFTWLYVAVGFKPGPEGGLD